MKTLCSHTSVHAEIKYFVLSTEGWKKTKKSWKLKFLCVCAHVLCLKTSQRISTKFCISDLTKLQELDEFQFGSY